MRETAMRDVVQEAKSIVAPFGALMSAAKTMLRAAMRRRIIAQAQAATSDFRISGWVLKNSAASGDCVHFGLVFQETARE